MTTITIETEEIRQYIMARAKQLLEQRPQDYANYELISATKCNFHGYDYEAAFEDARAELLNDIKYWGGESKEYPNELLEDLICKTSLYKQLKDAVSNA